MHTIHLTSHMRIEHRDNYWNISITIDSRISFAFAAAIYYLESPVGGRGDFDMMTVIGNQLLHAGLPSCLVVAFLSSTLYISLLIDRIRLAQISL